MLFNQKQILTNKQQLRTIKFVNLSATYFDGHYIPISRFMPFILSLSNRIEAPEIETNEISRDRGDLLEAVCYIWGCVCVCGIYLLITLILFEYACAHPTTQAGSVASNIFLIICCCCYVCYIHSFHIEILDRPKRADS